MTRRNTAFVVCAWTIATIVATTADVPSALRAVFVVPFVLACPGFGWSARFVGAERDVGDLAIFVVATSLAAAMIVGEFLALSERWSPTAGLFALAAISFGGVAAFFNGELRRPLRPRRGPADARAARPVDV